jgi:hypothetical protein
MGLDMYAARRLYVKQWEHDKPEDRYTVKVEKGGKPVPGLQSDCISYVEEEVMYWRKANHIHQWFVENVQESEDDCKTYYVDESKIRELHLLCKQVVEASKLVDGMVDNGKVYNRDYPKGVTQRVPGKVIENASLAQKLLPTAEGFFFGSTEYGEDYLSDVNDTLTWTTRMIADFDAGVPGDIYYHSSW